jgi:uncharacterized protein (DUF305 family)
MFTTTTFRIPQLTRALRLGLAAAAAVTLTSLAGCANNDAANMPGMDHSSSSSTPAGPSSSAAAPPATGATAVGPHNDTDVTFATMMIPHHQQAIEMSDMILAKDGIDPAVTELARQIKDAQAPEISQMSGWLAGWGANPSPSMSGMDHGGGLMDPADMEALENANGAEAAKLFLTGMVKHHQGAIAMAQTEVSGGQNPEAKKLAQAIITSQQAEIEKMNTLLARL